MRGKAGEMKNKMKGEPGENTKQRYENMTDEEYLNRVGRGVEDMRNGRVTSDEDYLKEIAEEENK